jgi:hypothetical protein
MEVGWLGLTRYFSGPHAGEERERHAGPVSM